MRYYSSTAGAMTLTSSITSGDTAIVVSSTTGLPVSFPYTLVLDPDISASEEIVFVTAAAGTTLTVTRAQDGTSAQAHALGATVRHMFIAQDAREAQAHIAASTNVHGLAVSSAVVGTTDTQTVDNKTFQPSAGDHAALTVRQAATQTVSPFKVLSNSGTTLLEIDGGDLFNDSAFVRNAAGANFWGEVFRAVVPASKNGFAADGTTGYGLVISKSSANKVTVDFDGNASFAGQVQSNSVNFVTISETQTLTNKTINGLTGDTATFSGAVAGSNIPSTIAATSATKNKKALHWGSYTVTLDASGYATVTHGAGFTPSVVAPCSSITTFVSNQADMILSWDTPTGTTFRIRGVKSETGAVVSGSITFTAILGE